MIILSIIILFIISLALRITASGVSTLEKVNNRVIKTGAKATKKVSNKASDVSSKALSKASKNNQGKINKASRLAKKGKNAAIDVGSKGVQLANKAVGRTSVFVLKLARLLVDTLRRLLTAILPVVVVLDIIVAIVLVTVASMMSTFGAFDSAESSSGGNKGSIIVRDDENQSGDIQQSESSESSGEFKPVGNSFGEKVVSEAQSHVDSGVPLYVYGGGTPYTDDGLVDGTDCSGFICSIYTKLGYKEHKTLWNYRGSLIDLPSDIADVEDVSSLSNEEKAIRLAKTNPGDVLRFSGHVGICDGDSGMIHIYDDGLPAAHVDKESFASWRLGNLLTIIHIKEL